MSARLKVSLAVIGWLATVTFLHLWLNLHALEFGTTSAAQSGTEFRVGFIPVT